MTDIVDVIRAVSELVERVFGAPPITKDITEGFDLPCTYVQPTLMQTSLEGGLRHDSYSIEIIRFGPRTGTVGWACWRPRHPWQRRWKIPSPSVAHSFSTQRKWTLI